MTNDSSPPRLKSLELQGYKTFASRQLFEFAGKITAIVGPNGSGKSNIADALRWVLGEQSYSLLRARKTEDMIFSGSEQRTRAGMASATVLFDNRDGWLPIDFNEVAITRRAYRDGQNEYLINRQRVRLKDVAELLAQSGLAERTYTIIGQGLVDAALSLKAEERRRLFEEAAGIGLHRSRREEALRRLDTTQRNLERVQDILAELQPRLRSLERQARRAREYEQVKADLRELLREWYGYHWRKAQSELAVSRRAVRTQESRLNRARHEAEELEGAVTDQRTRIQALRERLNGWHRSSAGLHTRREAISRDLAVGAERQRALQEQIENAGRQAAHLEEELAIHFERLQDAEAEVGHLTTELAEAREQVETARRALSARQAEHRQAEEWVNQARRDLGKLNAQQGQLQARQSERQSRIERDHQALEAAVRALSEAERARSQAASGLEQARRAQKDADADLQAAGQALEAHRKRMAEVSSARQEAQESRGAIAADLARITAHLDVLDEAEQTLSGYSRGAQLLLKAVREENLSGALGALSSFIEVPVELEVAVAAALGEYLEAVLLKSAPEPALDLLAGDGARGVLLPVDDLNANGKPSLPKQAGDVLGRAADLVTATAEALPAVELLLGETWIVRDRQTARRIVADLEPPLRVVTLDGEIFHAAGPVLRGGRSASGEGSAGLLTRQRQRRELAEQCTTTETRLQDQENRLSGLKAEQDRLQEAEERLIGALQASREAAAQSARKKDAALLAAEQADRQLNWQDEQRDRLTQEIERGQAQAAEIQSELETLQTELDAARQELRAREKALHGLSLDEQQNALGHWNTRLAVADRALADGQARFKERQAALQRAKQTQAGLETRRSGLAAELESLQTELSAKRQAETEIGGQIAELRLQIDPAEAELDALEAEQESLQARETTKRQAVSQAEHLHAQARIALARQQEAFDHLRRRIVEDFGLVAFEYEENVSGPTPLPLEGMVEELPRVDQLSADIEDNIRRQRTQLRRMGAINPEAQTEYEEVRHRFEFLTEQMADLRSAEESVRQVIAELDHLMEQAFRATFDAVAEEFKVIFTRLFGGGAARLVLTEPDNLTESGIDIEARLPGRRTQGLSLLSGGERSLTATALVFSLLKVSPTPFCVLDEVDAMLDEANVGRFRELLRELSANTQFIIITHNRNTVQAANVIYGITMGRDTSSQVVSLKMDEVSQIVE